MRQHSEQTPFSNHRSVNVVWFPKLRLAISLVYLLLGLIAVAFCHRWFSLPLTWASIGVVLLPVLVFVFSLRSLAILDWQVMTVDVARFWPRIAKDLVLFFLLLSWITLSFAAIYFEPTNWERETSLPDIAAGLAAPYGFFLTLIFTAALVQFDENSKFFKQYSKAILAKNLAKPEQYESWSFPFLSSLRVDFVGGLLGLVTGLYVLLFIRGLESFSHPAQPIWTVFVSLGPLLVGLASISGIWLAWTLVQRTSREDQVLAPVANEISIPEKVSTPLAVPKSAILVDLDQLLQRPQAPSSLVTAVAHKIRTIRGALILGMGASFSGVLLTFATPIPFQSDHLGLYLGLQIMAALVTVLSAASLEKCPNIRKLFCQGESNPKRIVFFLSTYLVVPLILVSVGILISSQPGMLELTEQTLLPFLLRWLG
ncbi:MAG: hypothetical protein AAF358_08825 [Pseudomonadota bacterium]